jgi:hypothetical protein
VSTSSHHLYIVTLRGGVGGAFTVSMIGNPRIDHDPSRSPTSVHAVMITDEGAEELLRIAECFGVEAVVQRMNELTEEQRIEQARLLGRMGQEERVWPTVNCPSCFWFDPLQEEVPCGTSAWPVEVRREAYKTHETARADLGKCPLFMSPEEWK